MKEKRQYECNATESQINDVLRNVIAHKAEIDVAFSHKKPYYVGVRPMLSCFGLHSDSEALDYTKVVFYRAGYNPEDYNFYIKDWDDKVRSFIAEITVKEK